EVERLVRQRVGQDRYRDALLAYWGGACAVTGVTVTETLRASHAKPWAECTDDTERLDAFNGFLLVANLDALFDRFLISFDGTGRLLISVGL
ncbi:HNH endonuclease, partial [Escherichia coli]|uniref:HNH endonuclease n=2 Tax=Gammaproteobacteria TaxID=1236 RepID=UPI00390CA7A8